MVQVVNQGYVKRGTENVKYKWCAFTDKKYINIKVLE